MPKMTSQQRLAAIEKLGELYDKESQISTGELIVENPVEAKRIIVERIKAITAQLNKIYR